MQNIWIIAITVTWTLFTSQVWAKPLQFPLTIEMPLLRTLIVQQAYPYPGEKASLLKLSQDCNRIILSNPQVTEDRGYIRFQTKVQLKWGTPVLESCLVPFLWEGSVVLWQRPKISSQWQLSFETVNSTVLDQNGRPMKTVDLLWGLIKEHIHSYLNKISINLAPPVADMKTCLLPMFDRNHQRMAQHFFAGMRPDRPLVQPNGIRVNILGEIELPPQNTASAPVPQLDRQGYSRVIELWQTWDDYLILQLKHFTDTPLTDDDRRILLNTMLTVRYEFTEAIEQERMSDKFIKDQFLSTWNQLAPVFHNHLPNSSQTNILGYLAFFTANDALRILDRLGPAAGIEISEDGFRRLAHLISTDPFGHTQSSTEADQKLRKVFGLDPLFDSPLPTDKPIYIPAVEENDPSSLQEPFHWQHLGLTNFFTLAQALAQEPAPRSLEDIKSWTSELTPAPELLPRVRDVLQAAAGSQQHKLKHSANTAGWFEKMILASAWQESCFRQFHVKNKAITYLLSYNRSSVGIMQVNEQIWHGVYNLKQLRWNITYNSQAGSEIMALYLRDYLQETKPAINISTSQDRRFLAAWLYALYNGGPSQRKPFLTRYKTKKLFRSERLFLAKFDAVCGEEWSHCVHCLP